MKHKVCKNCGVRESIAKTVTGQGLVNGLCRGCRDHMREVELKAKKKNPRTYTKSELERFITVAQTELSRAIREGKKGRGLSLMRSDLQWAKRELAKVKRTRNPKPATKSAISRRASGGGRVAVNGGSRYYNIDQSGFRKDEYVGYGDGTWRIYKKGKRWYASRQSGGEAGSDQLVGHTLQDISKRLELRAKKNPVTAKRSNGTAADFKRYTKIKLQDLAKKFQGVANGSRTRLLESDYTPQDKYRLGYLVQMKIRGKQNGKSVTIPITFDGDSMLSADRRDNLHVSGKDARIQNGITLPKQGQLKYVGELVQIDYVTAKKHIENGETVRFFHKLGEVTKEVPNLFVDHEGFPIVQGGGYEIWDVGIVN